MSEGKLIQTRKGKSKKFFEMLYEGMNQNSDEYIRVYQNNSDFQKVDYYNNINDLIDYSNNQSANVYYTLATTNNQSGKRGDLLYRYFLAFDFDKKDLGEGFNYKDVTNLFMENKVYCHSIVESGNGYHAYVLINKTNDFDKVQ